MLLSLLPLAIFLGATAAERSIEWTLVQNGTTGIVPLEIIPVSPTLMLMYDRADGNPLLLPDGSGAWAGLYDIETGVNTPLYTKTDTFCAGGAFISNGTNVAIGGGNLENPGQPPAQGLMGIRLFDPCTSPAGENCTVFEDPDNIHLVKLRWYPTGIRIPDGSLMVLGGSNVQTWNAPPGIAENTFEFWPSRKNEEGTARFSQFLNDTSDSALLCLSMPANMFPRTFVLPSGRMFVIANNRSMVYDIETNTETRLPDLPNGVRIGVPFDGTAQLLALVPPLYEPTVVVCGGSATNDQLPPQNVSRFDPATTQCSRMTLTHAGIAAGWEVEHMPERRIMAESVILPTGEVIIINGAQNGYSGYASLIPDAIAPDTNAANPGLRGMLYRPQLPLGQRITQDGIPTSTIPRMYHSVALLTAKGNIMIAASNPHPIVVEPPTTKAYPTEYRVQYLNPDFITNNTPRPVIHKSPAQLGFNKKGTMSVTIPSSLLSGEILVSLMDPGYITHAQHSGSRLVFLEHTRKGNTLTITAPPNNNIYPPGPAWIYLVAAGVWSEGVQIMIGDGGDPPRPSQGVQLHLESL